MENVSYSKKITRSFDVLMAVLLGLGLGFVYNYLASGDLFSKLHLSARVSEFANTGVVFGFVAIYLFAIIRFACGALKKEVNVNDFFLYVVISSFVPIFVELVKNPARSVVITVIYGVLIVLAFLVFVLRILVIEKEAPDEEKTGKKYWATLAYKYNFFILTLVGVILGVAATVLCTKLGIGNILNGIPLLNKCTQTMKLAILCAIVGAFVVVVLLDTVINNKKLKVSVLDAFLYVVLVTTMVFTCYFAKSFPQISKMKLLAVAIAIVGVLVTMVLRSLFINNAVTLKSQKPSGNYYYHEVLANNSLILLMICGVVLAFLLVYIDYLGLSQLFKTTKGIVATFTTVTAAAFILLLVVFCFATKQLVKREVKLIDSLLVVGLVAVIALLFDVFMAFGPLRLVLWLVCFITVCVFICIRIAHVQGYDLPTEEPAEAIVEEPVEEVVEEETEEPVEEEVQEEPVEEVVEEEVQEEPVEEETTEDDDAIVVKVVEKPVVEETTEETSEDESFEVVEDGQTFVVTYNKSFEAKMVLNLPEEKLAWYNEIRNYLASYKKIKERMSWNYEAFNSGRTSICKIVVRGKSLVVFLGLEPKEYEGTKYSFKDMSESKKYAATPMMMKVKSARGVKHIKELIDAMAQKLELTQGEVPNETYTFDSASLEELLEAGKVKEVKTPKGIFNA